MHKAVVNDKTFEITSNQEGLLVNGKLLVWDLVEISTGNFHIIYNGKSYRAEAVDADPLTKTFSFKINGRLYPVVIKDRFDLLLEKMGMNNTGSTKMNHIKAPMPGLIVDLRVKPGDEVKTGDALLILEAMKMENILKAAGAGTVKTVKVKKGDSVEKGQTLIEF